MPVGDTFDTHLFGELVWVMHIRYVVCKHYYILDCVQGPIFSGYVYG